MFASSRRTPSTAAWIACLVLICLTSATAGRQPRTARATDPRPTPATSAAELRLGESVVRRAAKLPRNEAAVQGDDLSIDDGSSDGTGLLEGGLTLAVRLTPAAYPVKLTAIRIYFTKFSSAADPSGQSIRLVAFAGDTPKPPAGVSYLVDQRVTIPRTGAYVDFPIPNGPVITAGDLWVGYQAPNPHAGVGFATDTNGPQADRTYWLDYGTTTWGGPLTFTDGTKANAMIRARVATTVPNSGDFELRTDDGAIDGGLLRDGGLYVNRLTPPQYPAKLKSVRIFVPQMSEQPSPEGQTVKVIAFRDPNGAGAPPDNSRIDINQPVKLGKPGTFQDVPVDGPVIASGDIYVGFQAPDPHGGVGFPVDTSGQPFQRMFRSRDGGQTFTGPIELVGEGSQTVPVNLMVRAVVRLGASDVQPNFTLQTGASELDLGEGGNERLDFAIRGQDSTTVYTVRARFDPPAEGLTVTPAELQTGAFERISLRIASSGPSDTLSAPLILEATDGQATTRITVPVYLWRELASAAIGPRGGKVEAPAVSVAIPANGFPEERTVKIYSGKPVTGREGATASPVYRLGGLPDNYKEGLEIRLPLPAPKDTSEARAADPADGQVGVLQFSLPNAEGKTVPMQVFQPARVENGTLVIECPAKKTTVTNKFSFWMLNGWYTMLSADGNFYVFYPIGARDTAIWAAERLEKALLALHSSDVDVRFLDRISYVSTLGNVGVTTHPIRATLDTTLTANGVTRAGQIYLDLNLMKQEPGRTDLRSTPGHELMHIAQGLYGSAQSPVDWWLGKADPTVWGDDALSTWFEPHAIGEPGYVSDVMVAGARDFCLAGPLKIPGSYAGDRDYGYGAATFITYVHRYVDKSVPAKWLAQRVPDREPWALLIPLIGGHSAMANHWKNFGEKLFTRQLIPGANFPNPIGFMPLEDSGKFNFVKEGERAEKKWSQAHDLSMKFYSFLMPEGAPKLTDSTVLGFKILEKYPDADIYVLGLKSGKYYSMLRGAGELTLDAKTVESEPGLLVAVVNYSYDQSPTIRSRRDLTVRMGLADPTATIQGYTGGDRVIGFTYNFTTRNTNIPADATYFWNFGEKTANGRAVTTSWTKAGTYKIRLEVTFGSQKVTDEVTVVVAPDTPPVQKADVVFDVYRRVRNSFGTSNQRCNDYSITISDPSNKPIESGSSVARNGAYDTRLPVANGYYYSVRYNFTTPCPASGTVSGRFDVKNTVNGVMVEAPPCEQ